MSTVPIRIAYDASCVVPSPLTGVGYYTVHQLHALAKTQNMVHMKIFGGSAQPPSEDFRRLCAEFPSYYWRFPTRLRQFLWLNLELPKIETFLGEVDLAHGGFFMPPPAKTKRTLATVFDMSGLKSCDYHRSQTIALQLRMLRRSAKHATALVAISESCKRDIVEIMGVAPERVFVAPGGVRMEEFNDVLDTDRLAVLCKQFGLSRPYFIYLSTLEPRKNMPRLIEAYARVLQRHKDAPQLLLAGRRGWIYDEIFNTVSRLRLENDVRFTDYLDRADAVTLLKGAYACTYPSLYEGFGLPILEAMAARVPVMTSNVSSMPEVAGNAALLVDPESVDALEAGLESLLSEYDAALAKVDGAYARANTFSWEASAAALAGIYRNVMEMNP